jgi:hypothetical protein
MPKWLIILLVVLLLIILSCCGGFVTCTYLLKRGVDTAKESVGVSFGDQLPASFPKDIPVYSGFKPTFSLAPAGSDSGMVTLTGKGDPSDIGDFYEKTLADNGWKQTASNTIPDGLTQSYTKGDREATININKSGADTTLVINYGKKGTTETKEPDETPTTPRSPTRTPDEGAPPPPGDDTPPTPARPANNAGDAATPGAKLPANFPADVPVYSGLTPGFSFADKVKGSGSVMLSGKVDKDKTIAYYEKELAAKGWKQEQNTDIGAGSVLVYSKESRKLSMTVIPDADKGETMVTISYEKSE